MIIATKTIGAFCGEYRWLSNFAPCSIVGNIATYPTVEHAYQASKAARREDAALIALQPSPSAAKRMGRSIALRPEWSDPDFRIRVMHRLLAMKFRPSNSYGAKLIDTGDAQLIEGNNWGDRFWGVYRGEGENHLGRLLMERRATLLKLDRPT